MRAFIFLQLLPFALSFLSVQLCWGLENSPIDRIALVYDGKGACPESCAQAAAARAQARGFRVEFINEENWSKARFESAKVVIFPGGRAGTVSSYLTAQQKGELRDFIHRGGGYVGFCAGGFFATQSSRSGDGSVNQHELLGILPIVSQELEVPAEVAILNVNWMGINRKLYWEGGPFFQVASPSSIEPVAYYENGMPAAIRHEYGKGRIFLSGVHPEAPQQWRDFFSLSDLDGLDFDIAEDMISWAARDL